MDNQQAKTKYRIVELFSGIGSQLRALQNLGLEVEVVATCEWDIHAIIAYDVIHHGRDMPSEYSSLSKDQILQKLSNHTFSHSGKSPLDFDILKTYSEDSLKRLYVAVERNHNFVDITKLRGTCLPGDIDLMTYSFPCQDVSNVAAFHGYIRGFGKESGTRSSLLWEVGRLLCEMKEHGKNLPRFLLMENVSTLIQSKNRDNFRKWMKDLSDLGYNNHYYILNSSDFGIPQNRERLIMISVYIGGDKVVGEIVSNYFVNRIEAESVIEEYTFSPFYRPKKIGDLLQLNYKNDYIKKEAIESTPNDTPSRQRIWHDNRKLVLENNIINKTIDKISTITTKQDRNPNSGNIYFDSGIEGKANFRYLTPRECMLFMGFENKDYERLKYNNTEFHKGDNLFSRDIIYRLAGNSIPVQLLEGAFLQIVRIDRIIEETYYLKTKAEEINLLIANYEKILEDELKKRKLRKSEEMLSYYPKNANLLYVNYKTAVYIENCCLFLHKCVKDKISILTKDYWDKLIGLENDRGKNKFKEATNNGWNAIIVYSCFFDCAIQNNYDQIAEIIKANKKSNKDKGTTFEVDVQSGIFSTMPLGDKTAQKVLL